MKNIRNVLLGLSLAPVGHEPGIKKSGVAGGGCHTGVYTARYCGFPCVPLAESLRLGVFMPGQEPVHSSGGQGGMVHLGQEVPEGKGWNRSTRQDTWGHINNHYMTLDNLVKGELLYRLLIESMNINSYFSVL